MVTIEVNGKQVQAYDLIMRKEHALEIIAGKKPLEIRVYSDHYIRMFSDKELVAANEKARKEKRYDDMVQPFRTDVTYIHFHNYNNTWSLDVSIKGIGVTVMEEDAIKFLAAEFDFHDYDNEWQQYVGKPESEVPEFFYLVIDQVKNRVGI